MATEARSGPRKEKGELVWVYCRYLRCEKEWPRSGKPGRVYKIIFEVTKTSPGGPAVGEEAVRTVWATAESISNAAREKKPGLVEWMQQLSGSLHSPEQLLSEQWQIEAEACVKVDSYTGGWGVSGVKNAKATEQQMATVAKKPLGQLPQQEEQPEFDPALPF